jgi:hypothetical protein
MMAGISRLVALGASNLTRGFHTVVSAARASWGPEIEVLAALGHGRSYGAPSRVLIRTLPGILESGLWRALESLPPAPTRALVTDVGNDILYGFPPGQILAWVEETIHRLERATQDITLTDLPTGNIRRLSQTRYLVFRSILFPSSRISLAQVLKAAEQINAGLEKLSTARSVRLFKLDPAWYGVDPIHIRPSFWRPVWREILGVRSGSAANRFGSSLTEGLKLYLMVPEHRWIAGIEQFTPQSGVALSSGGRVWLY